MLDQMVRRVPVVAGGHVSGLVSASDIIQVFLNLHEGAPRRSAAEVQPLAAIRPAAVRRRGAAPTVRHRTRRVTARRR